MFFVKIIMKFLNLPIFYKMDDEKFLKIKYFLIFRKKLNLDNPETFNEKLQWLKLYNRKPEYTKMVDKYEVKKYIADLIGNEYLIPTLGIYDSFDDIDFKKLPNKFVIKCTHDSGSILICKDKSVIDINKAKKQFNKTMKRNFYYFGREWAYKNVKPRIIIEKYMEDESLSELKDYKVFNFNGQSKLIQVDFNRFSGHKRNMYNTKWEKLDMNLIYKINKDIQIEKPQHLEQILKLSSKLSKGSAFMRTDFYVIKDKIYFGEITFYPESGFGKFIPEKYDKTLGDLIELPKKEKREEI